MSDDLKSKQNSRVLWIAGAFGTGKTTTATLLSAAYPGTVVIDPEEIGTILRTALQHVVPVRDFQDWGAWRKLVAETINAVAAELPRSGPRLVIVPQTVTNEKYWLEILNSLKPGIEVVPIVLEVDSDEHSRRAHTDVVERNALRWRLTKFTHFNDASWVRKNFMRIETTGVEPPAVVEAVKRVLEPPD